MLFKETELKGAYVIEPELIPDERGFFARLWSQDEFAALGLNATIMQCNTAQNKQAGTLRGMHYQTAPYEETKLVRCARGAVYDVAVDLRPESSTYRKWTAVELSHSNGRMFYIPPGFAHGYQTLEDDTEVFYLVSQQYHADSARGVRWDDPAFAIDWPMSISVISERDRSHPLVDTESS